MKSMIGRLLLAAALAWMASSPVQGQGLDAARVGVGPFHIAATGEAPATQILVAPERAALSECTQDRLIGIVVGASLGAAAGWLLHTLTLGALAESHGTTYHRSLREWMWGGAVVGVTWAIVAPSPRAECRRVRSVP